MNRDPIAHRVVDTETPSHQSLSVARDFSSLGGEGGRRVIVARLPRRRACTRSSSQASPNPCGQHGKDIPHDLSSTGRASRRIVVEWGDLHA